MKILPCLALAGLLFTSTTTAYSQENKEEERVVSSIDVLKEFTTMKESIPSQLLKTTEGIIIIPGMKNAGFVVGGKRGKGIAIIKNDDGTWSNPVFITLTGGSFGLQVGYQSVDLVLVFKKKKTLENIDEGDFTLGGDISAAAGPVGRSSTASTDYKLEAEVYSYSKAKGLFAGVSLNGSVLEVDAKSNENYYGEDVSAESIFKNEVKDENDETATLKQTLRSVASK